MSYLRYDELEIGRTLEPVTYEVTEEAIDLWRRATLDDLTPRVAVDAQGRERSVAPLTLANAYVRMVYRSLPNPPGGIHAKQRYVFHRPVFAGDRLTTTAHIEDLYIKRDNRYVIIACRTVAQDGHLVTSSWATRIWAE